MIRNAKKTKPKRNSVEHKRPDKRTKRKYVFPILIEEDEDGFHAFCPVLRGCHTQGDTIDEAQRNVEEAVGLYVESLVADGESIPESKVVRMKLVEVQF